MAISFVPIWRLREIRNIADSMAYRAGHCPVGRMVLVAEREYLKPSAHIRLFIDQTLEVGQAYHYIQILEGACLDRDPDSKVDLIEVTICYNGNLSSRENWEKTIKTISKELAYIIFYSEATEYLWIDEVEDQKKVIDYFVKCVLKWHPFVYDNTNRIRFTLAHLKEVVRKNLRKETKEVLPHLQKLLMPYLGPDGW